MWVGINQYHSTYVRRSFAGSSFSCTAPLNCGQLVYHCLPSIQQRIQPSSSLHFSRDIRVHSLVTLLRATCPLFNPVQAYVRLGRKVRIGHRQFLGSGKPLDFKEEMLG
jgi:hypothetical protein